MYIHYYHLGTETVSKAEQVLAVSDDLFHVVKHRVYVHANFEAVKLDLGKREFVRVPLHRLLEPHMVPKIIKFTNDIPKTTTTKKIRAKILV
jgi:acyl-coenzyme A synthetase/AMP-(fatty) acid ligase